MKKNEEKTELQKLADKLYEKGIPFQLIPMDTDLFDGALQLVYPTKNDDECIFDFVCHKYSIGNEEGLLEMMDHRTDEVMGNLTADDAFEFILYDYVSD